jgi:hypothetical protein
MSCVLLALIFQDQEIYGVESKELLQLSLANFTRKEGPDGANTAAVTIDIGHFYYDLAMMQSMTSFTRKITYGGSTTNRNEGS